MKSYIPSLMALAMVCAFINGCQVQTTAGSSGSSAQNIEHTPVQVTSEKVSRRDIVGYRLLSGEVYVPADAMATVTATTAAPIQSLSVKQGDHVNRGQTLAILATGQTENYQSAKNAYDAALTAYNQALAQYEQPVRDLEHQLDQAKATEKSLRETTTPGSDATELNQATSNRKSLEDQIKVARAQARTNETQYKTQLDQTKFNLTQAKAGAKQAILTAPISGTVVELVGATGQELKPSDVIAKIVDLPSLSIKSDVMADDAQFVKKGGRVVIVFSDQPDRKFDGTVRKVDALPATKDGRVLYEASIDFTNTDGVVRPNSMVKSIGVIVGQRKGVLAVPVDAVSKGSGDTAFVNLQTSKGFVKTAVTIGLDDGNFVEIKSGLSDGDTVQVATGRGAWLTTAAPSSAQSKK